MAETILPWWEERGEGAQCPYVLPPVGVCAVDDEGPCAAAWLYQPQGCRVAILDWLVARPDLGAALARAACRLVFSTLADMARDAGAKVLFASVCRAGMIREAQACGFLLAQADCTHLVKHL